MKTAWKINDSVPFRVFLTLICCAMAADYLAAKPTAPAKTSPSAAVKAAGKLPAAKPQVCDADFNGDKIKESCTITTTATSVTLTVKMKKNEAPKIIEFAVGTKEQNSFCTNKVTAKIESPVMPLEAFCPTSNVSKPCEKLRAANVVLQDLAKKGGKGLVLSDGKCDKIHVHWSDARGKFDWWRSKAH